MTFFSSLPNVGSRKSKEQKSLGSTVDNVATAPCDEARMSVDERVRERENDMAFVLLGAIRTGRNVCFFSTE